MPFPKVPEAELTAPRGLLILIPLPLLFLDPLLLICIVGITGLLRLIIKLLILTILILFGWMGMTYLMRTAAYRDKERDYIAAARVLSPFSSSSSFAHDMT